MFQLETERIEKLLYRIAWSYLGNEQDVQDAVQDALVRAWEKRGSLRDREQFRPWMARILSNRCRDMLRKRRRWSFYPLEEDTAQMEMPEPEVPVWEAMKRLRPEFRIIMVLYYVDGYTVSEIAASLGIPEGTVKTRMRSARRQISKTLLVEWEEEV